jgi:hypothetical protein
VRGSGQTALSAKGTSVELFRPQEK